MPNLNIEQNDLKTYILAHFDEALEKGWIELYVQPVVRILTGDLCNFEGLARWNDPVYGLLPPAGSFRCWKKPMRSTNWTCTWWN